VIGKTDKRNLIKLCGATMAGFATQRAATRSASVLDGVPSSKDHLTCHASVHRRCSGASICHPSGVRGNWRLFMQKRCSNSVFAFFLIMTMAPPLLAAVAPVKVWEEGVTIPTYLIGPPDPNPQFYFGGASQGAQHRVYPYPVYDNLTTEKAPKTYKMVYLENEYVKIGILPELGGKIFETIDKTNGYDFIYHQHVIKPALISLLGA